MIECWSGCSDAPPSCWSHLDFAMAVHIASRHPEEATPIQVRALAFVRASERSAAPGLSLRKNNSPAEAAPEGRS